MWAIPFDDGIIASNVSLLPSFPVSACTWSLCEGLGLVDNGSSVACVYAHTHTHSLQYMGSLLHPHWRDGNANLSSALCRSVHLYTVYVHQHLLNLATYIIIYTEQTGLMCIPSLLPCMSRKGYTSTAP